MDAADSCGSSFFYFYVEEMVIYLVRKTADVIVTVDVTNLLKAVAVLSFYYLSFAAAVAVTVDLVSDSSVLAIGFPREAYSLFVLFVMYILPVIFI